MDMTYSEFQTPLFSPSYLNLVFEKHLKNRRIST